MIDPNSKDKIDVIEEININAKSDDKNKGEVNDKINNNNEIVEKSIDKIIDKKNGKKIKQINTSSNKVKLDKNKSKDLEKKKKCC